MGDPTQSTGGISQSDIDSLLQEVEQGERAAGQGSAATPPPNQEVKLEEWGLAQEPAKEQRAPAAAKKAPPPKAFPDVGRDLEFLMDVPLSVSVEVGRTRMTISDLLSLGPGSIVELEKLAGEPLDIFINQKLVARGEAVIVNEKFGVRLTDVISKVERIENLKE
jgi:flagellar motor switch protein FliN